MNLLHVDSSLLGARSVSRELSSAIVAAWQRARPETRVIYRDLVTSVPTHVTGDAIQTMKFRAPPAPGAERDLAHFEALLAEFLAADAVVIGAPMYNFGIPSHLKTWLDALALPGRTFEYTSAGRQGLAAGKRVVIASSRGATYSDSATAAMDFQEPHLVAVLRFMGITQIDIVRAEGVNLGPQRREAALQQAHHQIAELFPNTLPVAAVA